MILRKRMSAQREQLVAGAKLLSGWIERAYEDKTGDIDIADELHPSSSGCCRSAAT